MVNTQKYIYKYINRNLQNTDIKSLSQVPLLIYTQIYTEKITFLIIYALPYIPCMTNLPCPCQRK